MQDAGRKSGADALTVLGGCRGWGQGDTKRGWQGPLGPRREGPLRTARGSRRAAGRGSGLMGTTGEF